MAEAVTEILSPCPNPLCTGLVSGTQTICSTCQHELGPCPNCGKLISLTLGRCGRCGYRQKKEETTEPVPEQPTPVAPPQPVTIPAIPPYVIPFEAVRDTVTEQVAKAYYRMARAEADMAKAVDVLEGIRSSLMTNKNALEIWKGLNKEIGAAEVKSRKALIDLRKWFTFELFGQVEARLRELFSGNAETAWKEWLILYAEGLASWRLPLCQRLVKLSLPFPDEFRDKNFKRATLLILHERWTEIYPFFSYLAEHEFLNANTRARLLITVGQIYLYFLSPAERALPFFKQAESLAPNLPRCLSALGDYYMQMNDAQTATGFFERVIAVGSDEPDAYTGMGDLAAKQSNLEEARSWYQEAINKAGGYTLGFTQLLRLYGRPEFIDRYESHIASLAERASAVDETGEYRIHLDVGDAYSASKRFDAAQASYQRAIDLDPKRVSGYIWQGFTYLDEGESKFEAAAEAFRAALEVAPEGYYGSWGMGQLCEHKEQWREAAEWYAKVGERQPELKAGMLARVGSMHLQLAEYERAEQAFIESFKLDNSMDENLLNLADDYYRKYSRPEDARRLYKQIFELKGESFKPTYLCRLGNIDFFEANYNKAIEYYTAAIALDPQQAIFYANISDAYRLLKNWDGARSWLDKAFAVNSDKPEYDKKLSLIYNDEGNEFYAQGEYEQAIECYSQAEKASPASPRYVSNRALALEQMMPASSTPLELLERATADTQKAVELARSLDDAALLQELSVQLTGFQRRHAFASQFGMNALSFNPTEKVIRLFLKLEVLFSVVNLDQTALSDDFMKLIDVLHSHLTEKSGLRFPTIMVYNLEPPDVNWCEYALEMMSERRLRGNLDLNKKFALCPAEKLAAIKLPVNEPGNPQDVLEGYWLTDAEASEAAAHGIELLTPQEYLLRCVEIVLSWNLDKGCGHQEVASLLEEYQTTDSDEILNDPEKLHELTLALQDRLRNGESIADLKDYCAEFNSKFVSQPEKFERKSEPGGEVQPGYKSLQVGLSPKSSLDRNVLSEEIAKIQAELFNRLGVIPPKPAIVDKDDLAPNGIQVQAGDKELLRVAVPGPDEFAAMASVEEMRDRYPNAKPLDNPFALGVPALTLPRSEELEEQFHNAGYNTYDCINWISGVVQLEANNHADLFLTSELLEYYFGLLDKIFPALVVVTRHYFSDDALLELLRGRLRAGSSIKYMPEVLESFLSDPTTETAGVH